MLYFKSFSKYSVVDVFKFFDDKHICLPESLIKWFVLRLKKIRALKNIVIVLVQKILNNIVIKIFRCLQEVQGQTERSVSNCKYKWLGDISGLLFTVQFRTGRKSQKIREKKMYIYLIFKAIHYKLYPINKVVSLTTAAGYYCRICMNHSFYFPENNWKKSTTKNQLYLILKL